MLYYKIIYYLKYILIMVMNNIIFFIKMNKKILNIFYICVYYDTNHPCNILYNIYIII